MKGSISMLLAMALFEKSYLNVTTVTFTSLIVAELLNIYTEVIIFACYIIYRYQINTTIAD